MAVWFGIGLFIFLAFGFSLDALPWLILSADLTHGGTWGGSDGQGAAVTLLVPLPKLKASCNNNNIFFFLTSLFCLNLSPMKHNINYCS